VKVLKQWAATPPAHEIERGSTLAHDLAEHLTAVILAAPRSRVLILPEQFFDSVKRENCSPNALANAEIARRALIRMRRSVDDKQSPLRRTDVHQNSPDVMVDC
jgi:hypothetical protein